ncbi:hypothetical protein BK767_28265 [Bacillus thuringiensis serovar kyushuensis]|nr:hypothetical protein BK767_28265 [Bacillus thuringiensis serovar kyushuensis]
MGKKPQRRINATKPYLTQFITLSKTSVFDNVIKFDCRSCSTTTQIPRTLFTLFFQYRYLFVKENKKEQSCSVNTLRTPLDYSIVFRGLGKTPK